MDWQITIRKAENGFILSHPVELDDGKEDTNFIAVEDPSDGDETVTTQKLLWEIMEYFSLFGSKHDEVRVKIRRVDKNEKELED